MQRWLGAMGIAFVVAPAIVARANIGDPTEARRSRALDPGSPTASEAQRGEPDEPDAPDPSEVNLLPRVPMARAAGWFLAPEPVPSDAEEVAEAELDAYFDRALGRDRLEAGMVDGWYYETGRAMRARFRPDRDEVERERTAGMTLLQRAFDEMRRHAAPRERPMDVPGQPPPELRASVTDPTDRAQAVVQERWDWCNALNAPVTWYRVVVRVTHNPEGVLSAAWVLRSSGYPSLDEAALEAVREGAASRPSVPDSVVGERQAVRSDWAFELGDVATPIACMSQAGATAGVMCVDDPVNGTMCAFAGRGIIRTRVRLLAVVDATHFTPAELRAQRRARRRGEPTGAGAPRAARDREAEPASPSARRTRETPSERAP